MDKLKILNAWQRQSFSGNNVIEVNRKCSLPWLLTGNQKMPQPPPVSDEWLINSNAFEPSLATTAWSISVLLSPKRESTSVLTWSCYASGLPLRLKRGLTRARIKVSVAVSSSLLVRNVWKPKELFLVFTHVIGSRASMFRDTNMVVKYKASGLKWYGEFHFRA